MEIPYEEIMETMKKRIYNNFHKYSNSSISQDYIDQRLSIFKILQKIIMEIRFKSQTFFFYQLIIWYTIYKKEKGKIKLNLYKIWLSALCLSAKHCENNRIVSQLKDFVKIYNNIMGYKNIISLSDLIDVEFFLCQLLNIKLNYYSM